MTEQAFMQEAQLIASTAARGPLQSFIIDLWQRVRMDWSFASDHLAAAFRRHKRLSSRERRFVAETLYGLIRHARRVDEALAAAGLRAGERAPDELRILAYLVLSGLLAAQDAARHRPDVGWEKVAAIDQVIARERNLPRRIARRHSLPDWLAERLVADLGAEADHLAAALNQRAPMTVRANPLVGDADALVAALAGEGLFARRGRYADSAVVVETRTNLFALEAFRRGAFEAQDEGSQLVADLVAPGPRALVVDLCAGAGGKTLALAGQMRNRGRLVACDTAAHKLAELRRRARRAQVSNTQTVLIEDEGDFPPALAACLGRAQRVLLDVPCSGLGTLRRHPEAKWRLLPADLQRFPLLQRRIAERALPLLAPGGRLVYATCTVLAAENQAIVAGLLEDHPELELVSIGEICGSARAAEVGDSTARFLHLLPHRHGTDGFFAAVLRRRRR